MLSFTASATSPEIKRRALLRTARELAGAELRNEDHPTWRTVFRAIFELRPEVPVVIVIDEFQYLATSDEGLREVGPELNAVWEGEIRAYAASGGTPEYLDAVDDGRPLPENVVDLLLSQDGRVRIQVETALEQEDGLRDVPRHRSILASVGLERRTVGEIASALGQESDAPLKRMIKRLVALEYLEEERNYDASRTRAKRYRIADPARRFFYGLVLPFESAMASSGPWKSFSDAVCADPYRSGP